MTQPRPEVDAYMADHPGVTRDAARAAIRRRESARYRIGESGHTLKGVSILSNKNGEEIERWTKTGRAGRDDDKVVHIPDPKTVSKVSTLYDHDGKVTQQWIAERPADLLRAALWREWATALAEPLPRAEPITAPVAFLDAALLACYPVGDHHNGMLSWARETGARWDLDIAEQTLARAHDELIASVRPCETALIALLGDWLHYDSTEAVTPTNRNILDSDTRYPKMIRVGIRAVRRMIERAAARHGRVHVIVEIGNHDLASSLFLAEALANIYESNPRIAIDTSPMHFHYFEWGDVLIGTHHGHGAKMADLPLIMATDQPEAWGRTRHRYWWTGHVHHRNDIRVLTARDDHQVAVESFRVLAPNDAWAHQKGYRSIRDMKAIVMHRRFGEVERHTVKPEMWAPPELELAA